MDTMTNTVGHRNTEVALQLGLLFNPSEALKIGLVDQLVPEDQVLTTATKSMTKWLAIPGTLHTIQLLKNGICHCKLRDNHIQGGIH